VADLYGRQAFLELLASEGVTHLFGNPGTTELPIMQAVPDYPQLKFVLGLQEAIVVAMADGFARASRSLTAANVHVAPGLGNAMGALYNAKFSGSPVILTAGQQEQGHGLLEPLLYEPLPPIAAPLVKWAVEVSRVEDLPRIMRRAAKVAMTRPMGPVFISLPGDILNARAELDLGISVRIDDRVRPSDAAVDAIAAMLLSAKRPAIIAGQEIAIHGAFAQAGELASLLGAAVFQEPIPYAASFSTVHPQFVGMLTRNQSQVRATLEPYDMVLCLGADLLRMSVYSPVEPLPEHMQVVHLSERPWELGKSYRTDLAVAANVRETLDALLPVLRSKADAGYRSAADERCAKVAADNWQVKRAQGAAQTLLCESASPMDPAALMLRIADNLPADAIVVEEALTSSVKLPQFMHQRDESSLFGLASGGLGFAIPGAVGISMAKPGRPVVAIVGDGSAMYGIQGLWTAAHFRLPITYVITNNRSYRIIKERLVAMQGSDRFVGMDMRDPAIDFCKLAESFGLATARVTSLADVGAALKAAIASGRPNLIDISVADGFGA
jgi:benzoylformate decarboxylase